MDVSLTGFLNDDGGLADHRSVQDIVWPKASSGTITLTIYSALTGLPVDLTGTNVVLAVRRLATDQAPLISRQASIPRPLTGQCTFALVQADTHSLQIAPHRYDVQFTDLLTNRWQVVPASAFVVAESIALPAEPVTVPAAQVPLGLGPSGLQGRSTSGVSSSELTFTGVETVPTEWNWVIAKAALTTPTSVLARLAAIASKVGGNGRINLRTGGTIATADGTVRATTLVTSDTPAQYSVAGAPFDISADDVGNGILVKIGVLPIVGTDSVIVTNPSFVLES